MATGNISIFSIYASQAVRTPDASRTTLASSITLRTVLCGDFNAHYTDWERNARVDRRGRQVASWADDHALILLNDGQPTRIGRVHQRDTAIDLASVSPRLGISSSWTPLSDAVGSDHYPCVISLTLEYPDHPYRQFYTARKCNLKTADFWSKRAIYSKNRQEALAGDDADFADFTRLLMEAADKAMKRRGPPPSSPRHVPKPWWTSVCTTAVIRRRDALRFYLHNRSAANYARYHAVFSATTASLRAAKRRGWREFLQSLRPNNINMRRKSGKWLAATPPEVSLQTPPPAAGWRVSFNDTHQGTITGHPDGVCGSPIHSRSVCGRRGRL